MVVKILISDSYFSTIVNLLIDFWLKTNKYNRRIANLCKIQELKFAIDANREEAKMEEVQESMTILYVS
jgi:hypothetical protein